MAQDRPQFRTPPGKFVFPTMLAAPDTKFSDADNPFDDGEYKATLQIPVEGNEEFLSFLEKQFQEHCNALVQQGKTTPQKLKKIAATNKPWGPAEDKDGNELDGLVELRAKLKAAFKTKQGSKQTQRVMLFDGAGTPLDVADYKPGPGSEGCLAGRVNCWHNNALGAGMTLWVEAAQILKYVEDTFGERSASGYGFATQGEGFASPPEPGQDADVADASDL